VGNTLTFEALRLVDYPLILDEQADLIALLWDPAS
jgi:hypothetical protein